MREQLSTTKTEKESEDGDLATNKVQEDHFQLPFQQHNALLTDNLSKMKSVEKSKKKRTTKYKHQKIQQYKKNNKILHSRQKGDTFKF